MINPQLNFLQIKILDHFQGGKFSHLKELPAGVVIHKARSLLGDPLLGILLMQFNGHSSDVSEVINTLKDYSQCLSHLSHVLEKDVLVVENTSN